jgi:hypothetical protein
METDVFTLRDFLELKEFPHQVLLTPGLDPGSVVIRHVSVIEAPIERFVRRDELVLTTVLGCRDSEEAFLGFMRDICDSGAAAVAVSFPEDRDELVPPSVLAWAESRGVPVVRLPWAHRFAEITETVVARLRFAQAQKEAAWEAFRKADAAGVPAPPGHRPRRRTAGPGAGGGGAHHGFQRPPGGGYPPAGPAGGPAAAGGGSGGLPAGAAHQLPGTGRGLFVYGPGPRHGAAGRGGGVLLVLYPHAAAAVVRPGGYQPRQPPPGPGRLHPGPCHRRAAAHGGRALPGTEPGAAADPAVLLRGGQPGPPRRRAGGGGVAGRSPAGAVPSAGGKGLCAHADHLSGPHRGLRGGGHPGPDPGGAAAADHWRHVSGAALRLGRQRRDRFPGLRPALPGGPPGGGPVPPGGGGRRGCTASGTWCSTDW